MVLPVLRRPRYCPVHCLMGVQQRRLAPQVAAVELDQFGSLSLFVRVEPSSPASAEPPTAKLLVPSGGIDVRLAVVGTGDPVERGCRCCYYFERVAAAAPATALARSSCPFGA